MPRPPEFLVAVGDDPVLQLSFGLESLPGLGVVLDGGLVLLCVRSGDGHGCGLRLVLLPENPDGPAHQGKGHDAGDRQIAGQCETALVHAQIPNTLPPW